MAKLTSRLPPLVIVAGLAFGVRLCAVWVFENRQVSDAATYHALASHLATTGRFEWAGAPSAWWPIGYPAFLAGLYRFVAWTPVAGELANAVLGTITVMLTFKLGARLSNECGLVAGILMALMPSHIWATNLLTTETLCAVLWLAAVVILWPPATMRRTVLAGVVLGGAALVRPTVLAFPLFWSLALWLPTKQANAWRSFALLSLGMALAIAPWTFRNVWVLGGPVLISTNGSYNLWVGNNPLASGNYLFSNGVHSFSYAQSDSYVDRRAGEREQAFAYRERALRWIAENPMKAVALIPRKLWFLWATDNDAASWLLEGVDAKRNSYLYIVVHGITLAAYLGLLSVGTWTIAFARPPDFWLLISPAVTLTIVHAVYFADDRFHFPALPFLAVLAAYGMTVMNIRLRSLQQSSR